MADDTAGNSMDQDAGSDGAAGGAAAAQTGEERTFTQADIDRIVQDRLKRQAAQFSDYQDLKTKAARLDEFEAAQRTELENAQRRTAELEQQLAAASQAAQEDRLRAAIVSEAARRNVRDTDAAVALIDRSLIQFEEDGAPKNIAEAMDELLKAKDYLVAQQGGATRGSADQGARSGGAPGQLSRDDLKSMTPADIVKAQKDGRLNDLMGVSS